MTSKLIESYFLDLTDIQREHFSRLTSIYEEWNAQINVISRKDMDDFYLRHVLHSLGIAKIMQFAPESSVLDIGTGGGFPGIPLAILFPEVQFHLVDSIGKKIKVVQEVVQALGLKNVRVTHARAEDLQEQYDFIVSRAVTAMPAFLLWTKGKFLNRQLNTLKNGILYLKGGDLTEELKGINYPFVIHPLNAVFKDDFFETKAVVYVKVMNR